MLGKTVRAKVPRSTDATLEVETGRDPVAYLEEQTPSRVQELVPIRYGRMLVSPFTFYRGAATDHGCTTWRPTPRSGSERAAVR